MTEEEDDLTTKQEMKQLANHLGVLQREAQRLEIPMLVVFEGLDASYKGKILNRVLMELDSRAFKVYSTHASHAEPRRYPLLHRFWNNTPAKGKIQFYDRSAYYLVLDSWAEGKLHETQLGTYWEDIRNFEQQLADDGVVIIKFFLTVPKKEQAKRFKKHESNPKTAWRVTEKDWRRHRQYQSFLRTSLAMVEETDYSFAPWNVVDTHDYLKAQVEIFQKITQRLQEAIDLSQAKQAAKTKRAPSKRPQAWIPYQGENYLSKTSFAEPISREHYKKTLKKRQETIHELVHEIHYHDLPVVMVYCGWDAAGKGGCIKRLVQSIDPRGYEVVPIAAPTKLELSHHYLWRFWKEMPKRGKITIFDRSWYGRVLVERVEGLCSNEAWQRAYREINEMESHLANFGTVIQKFWLHIDKDTQLERFKARESNPFKQWKITDEDWRNREKWDRYVESVNQMIDNTNTPHAPWSIVPSNCKMSARIQTLDVIIASLRKALKKPFRPPL